MFQQANSNSLEMNEKTENFNKEKSLKNRSYGNEK